MWTRVHQSLRLASISCATPTTEHVENDSATALDSTVKAPKPASAEIKANAKSVVSRPKVRRRSKLLMPKSSTPSLRVTDLGVNADGAPLRLDAPKESLGEFVVEPNSEAPYEFENDFVKGRLLFLLNCQDAPIPSRVESIFSGKRRLFWVQMQIQFKKAPSGILYIGGEVPRAMNLGFFTGGLTKIILSVVQSLVRGLHYGFGILYPASAATREDEELPHICFPLYTAVDQFTCTPPGVEPPVLGSLDFGESKEASIARRKSGQAFYEYNTTDTYSFHFHSYFIDFSRWKLQNVPGMRDVDLSAFWSDMPLQLVAYSIKPQANVNLHSESDAKKAIHSLKLKEYKFCFELSHRVQEQLEFTNDACDEDDIAISDEVDQLTELQKELSRYEFSIPAWFEYFSNSQLHSERRVGYAFLVREFNENEDYETGRPRLKSEYMVLHTALFGYAPLSFVEHELGSRKRSRTASGNGIFASARSKTLEESISVRSRSNKYSKIDDERQFLEHHLKQLASRDEDSGGIIRPDQLFAAQSALLDLLQNKRTSLHGEWPFLSAAFCRSNSFGSSSNILSSPGATTTTPIKDEPHAAAQVVRVTSFTRWRHEWITLDRSNRVLRFFRMISSSHSFSIPLDQVVSVQGDIGIDLSIGAAGDSETGCELFWMHIELLEKCYHIAFATDEERQRWIMSILETIESQPDISSMKARLRQPIIQSSERLTLQSFTGDASSKSRGSSRFVLNDRCDFVMHASQSGARLADPNELVRKCLKRVIGLQSKCLQEYSTKELVGFLDDVSTLKWISMDSIRAKEEEKQVFFLNLFHLIQIHASILGFLPRSKLQWGKFFNGASYNVGGMYFSLAEIEHCVIRASMSTLRLPIAFLVIPRLHEPDERIAFQLTTKDFRLNFALNCMTKSCWSAVIVYDTTNLDAQLDHITRKTVDMLLTYDRESRVVYLPKICDWYRSDFIDSSSNMAHETGSVNLSILRLLIAYMRESKRRLLEYVVTHPDAQIAKFKFTKYDYRFQEALKEPQCGDLDPTTIAYPRSRQHTQTRVIGAT
uniref:Uncharacterized protein n=1 Tax=Globisporangium ultimum (strain ATCC 200006 / CBS 805.95 / DAOM BR144) TaxID=431595 RepID=K3WT78_GLOUD